jgi:hypothetical protein
MPSFAGHPGKVEFGSFRIMPGHSGSCRGSRAVARETTILAVPLLRRPIIGSGPTNWFSGFVASANSAHPGVRALVSAGEVLAVTLTSDMQVAP